MDLATAEELLRQRIGLDPASSGTGLVPRAVRSRMSALGLNADQAANYQTLVNRSPRELQALIEEVVIPESWFFRDERPFSFIAERASAGWLHDMSRPPFRALSLPCAGGEEPYSIAMVLRDQGFSMARFEVVAVDVSQVNLDSARRGVYGRNSFRSADLAFRDRYFSVTQGGWLIDPLLSSTVIFRQGNLLDDRLLADGSRFDVVFCRNLLIYFDEPARRRALENIDRLLAPGGLLIVGHAEQLTLLNEHYRPIGDRRCFAYERLAERPDNPPLPRPVRSSLTAQRAPSRPPAIMPLRSANLPAIRLPEVSQATILKRPDEPDSTLLDEAAQLADKGCLDEAAALCDQEMLRRGPSAAIFHLLGVIRQAGGDREQAERCFEKAVYLEPKHENALLALSFLAQRRGDLTAAAGFRRRAARASQETPT